MFKGYMKKSARRNKDLKITTVQTESTDISPPSPREKKSKTWTEKISNSVSNSLHKTRIVSQIENGNKQEDDLLISYIKQDDPNEIWIKAKTNLAMDLAIDESAKQKEQTLEEMIPQELMTYQSVFDKIAANRFPD